MAQSSSKKRLVLLDTHAIIHRAYHALPNFSSSSGHPTGALYGLVTMLFKIITDLKPDYIVACYDLPKKTFRHEAYAGYKAGRVKTDDELIMQIKESRSFFEAFGIPMYDYEGFEADDILGTITETLAKDKKIEIIIASGDMDTLQLVRGDIVRVFTLKKGINDTIMYDEDAVMTRFGFVPTLLPDYKGLRGDPSDNIPGIKGIGEKTATELISTFGSVENLYKTLKKNPEKISVTPRILDILIKGEDEALFSKSLATIRKDAPITFSIPSKSIMEGVSYEKISELFKKYEFRSLENRLRTVFEKSTQVPNIVKKNETEISVTTGLDLEELKVMYTLLYPDETNPKDEDIIHFSGGSNVDDAKKNLSKALRDKKLDDVFENIERPLFPIIRQMEHHGILVDKNILNELSTRFHKEVLVLEANIFKHAGREFNVNSPKQLGEILFEELKISEGLKTKAKKTKSGTHSTKFEELEKYKDTHPIIPLIIRHREIQKLISTYVDVLPGLVGSDGRIHASFNQLGAATGRFSSTNPNLQNIPIKGNEGKEIRSAFTAPPGFLLVSFDYSQIELRIAALLSGDVFLKKIFNEGGDVHSAVAMKVFGVAKDALTPDMRRKAKVINFGIIYGMGVQALRANLGGTLDEARTFYETYFREFSSIASYLEGVKEQAKKTGYTETLFGRRRPLPALRSPIPFIRAMAERMAINAPIQGTSADCIKLAIINANNALSKGGLLDSARLVLQVHDELVFEVKESVVKEVVDIVTKEMESVLDKKLKPEERVPLDVHASSGKNWGELKD